MSNSLYFSRYPKLHFRNVWRASSRQSACNDICPQPHDLTGDNFKTISSSSRCRGTSASKLDNTLKKTVDTSLNHVPSILLGHWFCDYSVLNIDKVHVCMNDWITSHLKNYAWPEFQTCLATTFGCTARRDKICRISSMRSLRLWFRCNCNLTALNSGTFSLWELISVLVMLVFNKLERKLQTCSECFPEHAEFPGLIVDV